MRVSGSDKMSHLLTAMVSGKDIQMDYILLWYLKSIFRVGTPDHKCEVMMVRAVDASQPR